MKKADASWGISKTTGEKEPMILCLPGKWLLFITKTPMMEKNAYLRCTLPIWIIHIRSGLEKKEARLLQMGRLSSTTRIDTPLLYGHDSEERSEVLGKQMYTVSGDFSR